MHSINKTVDAIFIHSVTMCMLLILMLCPSLSYANPVGGVVAEGSVEIVQESPTKVNVVQSTDKAIVNWQDFSIGKDEHTHFQQPSSNSIILNRVTGSDPSNILGKLSADGRVVLVNPNGVFFSKDATVDVAAIIASTHDIRNEDFAEGKLTFNIPGKPDAQINNQGNITVKDGGLAALVAPSIQNSGIIAARMGKVALASGNAATIDFYGDNLILFETDSKIMEPLQDASGTRVTSLVNNDGSIVADGGVVLLTANAAKDVVDKAVNMTGIVQARTIDMRNGEIVLNGSDANISVSGTLDASATNGGNGGFIETSADHVDIQPSANITTEAPDGKTGQWLLDPADYYISASGGDITGAALTNHLNGNNIKIQTAATGTGNGDIFVNDGITWGNTNTLTLSAHRDINITAPITAGGGGSLLLRSDYDANGAGSVKFGGSGAVTMSSGGTATIFYNPSGGYTSPVNYAGYFTGATPVSYMLINSVQNLQAVSSNVAGTYALGKDIDASATANWNSGSGFLPIGNNSTPFTGIFDGDGHTINDLKINRPTADKIGLFGCTKRATIRNVGLLNAYIKGHNDVGALVGSSEEFTSITKSFNTGKVDGFAQVGGLAGSNNIGCKISDSYNSGTVTGNGGNVGGLVGLLYGTIGENVGIISNSYNTGKLTCGNAQVGGLVGLWYSGNVDNCYWDMETSGQSTTANSKGTGLTSTQMKAQTSFSNWDFNTIWGIKGNEYPHLQIFTSGGTVNPAEIPVVPIVPVVNPINITPISYLLSWTQGAPYYNSWDEYLKTNPFVMTVSMNKSIQLNSQGQFIDGMLNPLDYLTPVGVGGIGFANLNDGGIYKGYSGTGSSYDTKMAWAAAALLRAFESSKPGNTYDPAVAKIWEEAALNRIRSRTGAGHAGTKSSVDNSGQGGSDQGGSGSFSQGSINGSDLSETGESDKMQRRTGQDQGGVNHQWLDIYNDLKKLEYEKFHLDYSDESSLDWLRFLNSKKAEVEIAKTEDALAQQDIALQKLVDNGTLNSAFIAKDSRGHSSIMNEVSTNIQKDIMNGTTNFRFCSVDNTGNWLPQTPEQLSEQARWKESESLFKRVLDNKLDANSVGRDSDGYFVLLNDKSITLRKAIEEGRVSYADAFWGTDGQYHQFTASQPALLGDKLKDLDSGEKAEKIVEMVDKNWMELSYYNDTKNILQSLEVSDLTDLIADANSAGKGRAHLKTELVIYLEPSRLAEAAQELSTEELGKFVQAFNYQGNLKEFLQNLPQNQLSEIAPYLTPGMMSTLVDYAKPELISELAKGLPEGWEYVTKAEKDYVYNITNIGKPCIVPDVPFSQITPKQILPFIPSSHEGQSHGM